MTTVDFSLIMDDAVCALATTFWRAYDERYKRVAGQAAGVAAKAFFALPGLYDATAGTPDRAGAMLQQIGPLREDIEFLMADQSQLLLDSKALFGDAGHVREDCLGRLAIFFALLGMGALGDADSTGAYYHMIGVGVPIRPYKAWHSFNRLAGVLADPASPADLTFWTHVDRCAGLAFEMQLRANPAPRRPGTSKKALLEDCRKAWVEWSGLQGGALDERLDRLCDPLQTIRCQ